MTQAIEQAYRSDARPDDVSYSASSDIFASLRKLNPAPACVDRQQVIGAAAVLVGIGGGLAMRMLDRHAQERRSRSGRVVWKVRSLRIARRPARVAAPVRAVRGATRLGTSLVARARHVGTHAGLDHWGRRIAILEAETAARVAHDRPRAREVGLGAVALLALTVLNSWLVRH